MMNTEQYRQQYRAEHIPGWYVGYAHLGFTVLMSVAIITWGCWQLEAVRWYEWLMIPFTFVYANLMEYLGHRYVMHIPRTGLKTIYLRHSKQHHRFFTDQNMPFDGHQDYKVTLFPLLLVVFFFGVFGTPVWLLINFLLGANMSWLFVIVAVAYFLNYELFHFAYHCREDSWLMKIPGFSRMRQLHLHHHVPELMSRYNFNITYPIGDWLFGTYYSVIEPMKD
jgi:hypothetical protein